MLLLADSKSPQGHWAHLFPSTRTENNVHAVLFFVRPWQMEMASDLLTYPSAWTENNISINSVVY